MVSLQDSEFGQNLVPSGGDRYCDSSQLPSLATGPELVNIEGEVHNKDKCLPVQPKLCSQSLCYKVNLEETTKKRGELSNTGFKPSPIISVSTERGHRGTRRIRCVQDGKVAMWNLTVLFF